MKRKAIVYAAGAVTAIVVGVAALAWICALGAVKESLWLKGNG